MVDGSDDCQDEFLNAEVSSEIVQIYLLRAVSCVFVGSQIASENLIART